MEINRKTLDESMLKEWFSDSIIMEIISEKNKLTIFFSMDTQVSPGKSFGKLILKNPVNYDKIILLQNSLEIIIRELIIVKKLMYGETSLPVVMIETAYKEPDDYFEIPCEDFSFERIDDYKKK